MTSKGPVVWARCARAEHVPMIAGIAARLTHDGDDVTVMTTDARDHPTSRRDLRHIFATPPALILWIGGALHPATLQAAEMKGVPVVLVDGERACLTAMSRSWLALSHKALLGQLQRVFALDTEAARDLTEAGVRPNRVEVIGPLEADPTVLPYRDTDHRDMIDALRTRPVWYARDIAQTDVPMLAEAQRQAARRSHRLLLIVSPRRPDDGPAIAEAFQLGGCNVQTRSTGADPDDATQVYVGDLGDEDGLWLRLAPVCLSGGSLDHGATHDPYEAAALGSVVIHGAAHGHFSTHFHRLIRGGASYPISGPDKLGHAVESLLSSDRAARMATAGWDVTSRGAELTSRLVQLIQDRLDGVRL